MPKTILAICGPAAVGKATFIHKILSDRHLRQRFGIQGTIRGFGPPIDQLEKMPSANCDVAIWKWQHWSRYYLYGLQIEFPDIEHRAILLWRPPHKHLPAHQEKAKRRHAWAAAAMTKKDLRAQWKDWFRPHFGPGSFLQETSGIVPELVDASNDYQQIKWDVVTGEP